MAELIWFEIDFVEDGTEWRAYYSGKGHGAAEKKFRKAHPQIRKYILRATSRPTTEIEALESIYEERTP